MGMLVHFLRADHDCTNGGVSGDEGVAEGFCVTNVNGPFNPSDDYPAATLTLGPFDTLRLVPEALTNNGSWVMFGGNYATTSDSRWIDAIAEVRRINRNLAMNMTAVPVFDRVED